VSIYFQQASPECDTACLFRQHPFRSRDVTKPPPTVRDQIRAHYNALTQSERKFAQALLDSYPAAGLASITIVAANAGVSTPTIARMVQKLGYKGYPQFHQALLKELEAKVSGPTQRRANWASEAPATHSLNRFAQAVTQNIEQTFANIDSDQFDAAARLLADTDGRLYLVGGRITRALADYAFTHFQAVRGRVTHMTSSSATWPHYVLDMVEGDTLLMFDIRRYETSLMRLAEIATARGVRVVLITDQWMSPISDLATHTFNCWVEIPSAWDSNISTMMLLEALIAAVQEERWPATRERYEQLDELFNATRLFQK
jgi:DNA-binding MurR/RpiR family transcriptional regulator